MKKFLLSLFAALFTMTAVADTVKMTKCFGDASLSGFGAGRSADVSAVTQFSTDEVKPYVGGKITGVRCHWYSSTGMSNVKVWVKRAVSDSNYLASADVTSPKQGWNEITFDTPVEITEGMSIALGYSYKGTSTCYPLSFSNVQTDGGLYLNVGQGYTNYSSMEGFGNLSIEAFVSDVTVDQTNVNMLSMAVSSDMYEVNSIGTAKISYVNYGVDFSSVTFRMTCCGKTTDTKVEGMAHFGELVNTTVNFETPDEAAAGIEVTAQIIAVDDQPYESAVLSTNFGAFEKLYDRTVVIEEGTGTWCGYCVRGIVAMEQMREKYPDSFIGIAVHSGDAMEVSGYANSLGFTGFPGCVVDRLPNMKNLSVSPDLFEEYYETERARRTYADFEFNAVITANKKIEGKTTCTFDYNETGADIRFCYVVIEDGVKGYSQSNYYANGVYGKMGGFESKPSTVTDITFNDVARATYPTVKGGKLQVGDGIVKGQEYTHEFSYVVPTKVKNADNLSLAALMIDGKTGVIIQGHKIKLAKEDSNAIDAVSVAQGAQLWYNLNGTLLQGKPTAPGLYIHNGKKIIVRE